MILDLRLIPSTMIGIGLDNTNSMIGAENVAAAILKKEYAPYLQVNGCFGHLFNLSFKHSFENLRHLQEIDDLIKKVYKYFSKFPKKLLDLEKWFNLKGLKYHKLLTIFDVRWLSRANSVSNYRKCLVAVLDILLKQSSDLTFDKKTREKALKLYNMAITYENMFLTYVLSDILTLCSRVCKMFQSDSYQLYEVVDTISDLKKCLEDAYLSKIDEILGI